MEAYIEMFKEMMISVKEMAKSDFYDENKSKDYYDFLNKLNRKEINPVDILFSIYKEAYEEAWKEYHRDIK
jgi:hypothetical protein